MYFFQAKTQYVLSLVKTANQNVLSKLHMNFCEKVYNWLINIIKY